MFFLCEKKKKNLFCFFPFFWEQSLNFCDHSPFIFFSAIINISYIYKYVIVITIYEPFIMFLSVFLCLDIRKVNKTFIKIIKDIILFLYCSTIDVPDKEITMLGKILLLTDIIYRHQLFCHFPSEYRAQFHQHFTSSFFIRKCDVQLFWTFSLCL